MIPRRRGRAPSKIGPPFERRKDCESATTHGCCLLQGQLVWNWEHKQLVRNFARGVATVADLAGQVVAVVRRSGVEAVLLVVVVAAVTVLARVALRSNTDSVSRLELGHLGTDTLHMADDLVTGNHLQHKYEVEEPPEITSEHKRTGKTTAAIKKGSVPISFSCLAGLQGNNELFLRHPPVMVCTSEAQTPQYLMAISTS